MHQFGEILLNEGIMCKRKYLARSGAVGCLLRPFRACILEAVRIPTALPWAILLRPLRGCKPMLGATINRPYGAGCHACPPQEGSTVLGWPCLPAYGMVRMWGEWNHR